MHFVQLCSEAAVLWFRKDVSNLAAVISYFAVFALAPLFLISIVLVGYLFGEDVVSSVLVEWGVALGANVLELLATAVENLRQFSSASILGALFLMWVIVTGFTAVGRSLDTLWSVSSPGSFATWIRRPLRSVLFIVFLQFYIAVLIGIYGVLLRFPEWFPFGKTIYTLFQLIALAFLFAVAFRVLAVRSPAFTSLFAGGFVSAVLFLFAKYMVDFYLGTTPVTGVYESAGLLIVLLVWIYISAAILFYGAAFAFVHAGGQLRSH